MRTVRDRDGNHYALVKRSGSSSLVRDTASGERAYLPNDELTVVDRESSLETIARAVPESIRRLIVAVHSPEMLGLLVYLADAGPTSVRHLLETTDLCESDLQGTLTVLRASGLVEESRIHGEPGYELTDEGSQALDAISMDE